MEICNAKIFTRSGEDPKKTEFEDDEMITFNTAFKCPKKKFIIVPKPLKAS